MKAFYDFHIHSALSPCASDEMTPTSIVAVAALKTLDIIGISDHNAIENVMATIESGKDFNIMVVPAIEVQTSEDIHILALFYDFSSLEKFYNTLTKRKIKNKEHIFGKQLIINADDEIVGTEENLLLVGIEENIYKITKRIKEFGGIPVLAHIDREENGIVAILGEIPLDLDIQVVELSKFGEKLKEKYSEFTILYNSDAHTLDSISEAKNFIEVKELSIKAILDTLKGEH